MKNLLRLAVVAAFFTFSASVQAQVAGRLSGSVADPTGAVIPGATVNVYLVGGKEPVLTGKSNEAGLFLFTSVRPETYDVGIEAAGFGKTVVRGVKVSPLQEVSLGAIKVDVLTATQSVDVVAEVQAVSSTNAELTQTITNEQVQNLPVLGRQVSALFQTMPGVSAGSNVTSVNGLRSSYSNVTLDGINIQDNYLRVNALDYAPMRTTIDQVAEISVSTSNQAAAIGGGATQFTLSTKSGSNTYHGSAYWYNRNSALASNDWFNNASGVEKTRVNLNQPGVALGGHIIKDKLFFYANYELYRNKSTSSYTRTVLTDSAKNGVFTYVNTSGVTTQANLHSLRSFTDDPTVKAMIAQLPSPNYTSGDTRNTSGYRFNPRNNEFRDQFVYKGDYYVTAKHSISGTYNYISNPTDRPDLGTFYTSLPPVSNTIKDHLLSLSWRWTVSPSLTNEVRGGFMRASTGFLDSNKYGTSVLGAYSSTAATGLMFSNPVNTFLQQGRDVNTYTVQDNANWVKGKHQVSFGFQSQIYNVTPWNDAGVIPTYTLGMSSSNTNALTASDLPGIKSSDLNMANLMLANFAGYISSAAQTFNVNSTTSGFVPGANNTRQLNYKTYAGYIQDNWKVRPNLTLSYGMRYEYWTPLTEKNKLYLEPVLQNGDPKATLLNPVQSLDFFGGRSNLYEADKNNFAPNIGFAWQPFGGNSKLTIRGGYMMAYVNDNVVASVSNNANTTSGLSFGNTVSNMTSLLSTAPTVPAPTYKVPRTLADNYALTTTTAIGLVDPHLGTPRIHQWNLTVQREVSGFVLAAHYVGNKGSDLIRAVDYNQVLYNANGFLADFQRAASNGALSGWSSAAYNPNIAGSQALTVFPLLASNFSLTSSTNLNYLRTGQVGELANTLMVNKQNGSVNFYANQNTQGANYLTNGSSSNYHSAQFEVTRRTRSGLQLQFSYGFSKGLSNAAGDSTSNLEALLDNSNPSLEWARTPYDIRHVLKANYYYELPFGQGKRWSGNRVTNRVIGGWSLAGIWNYQSGSPYSILSGYGTLNRAARSTYTNTASVVGTTMSTLNSKTSGIWKGSDGTVTFVDPSLIGPDGRGASQAGTAPFSGQVFYNPSAGNVRNTQRRMFSGPWLWSWDFSVKKSITLRERHTLDLHCDIFNWTNHPTFYIYPSTGGSYGSSTYVNVNNTTFGQVDGMQYSPRVVQLGAYYRF